MALSKTILNMIRSFVEDGLSNREILKKINKHLVSMDGIPITASQLSTAINDIMDSEDSSSVDTFDSDYEDEEWTDEESEDEESEDEESEDEESEDEESEDEESEDEESEDEESEDEESEDEESEDDENKNEQETPVHHCLTFYMNHEHGEYHDRIRVTPAGMGEFHVVYAYDKKEKQRPRLMNEFNGTAKDVYNYLYHILHMLAIDERPYQSIDLDIPYYPLISVRPGSLKEQHVRHTIMDAVDEYLDDNDTFEEEA